MKKYRVDISTWGEKMKRLLIATVLTLGLSVVSAQAQTQVTLSPTSAEGNVICGSSSLVWVDCTPGISSRSVSGTTSTDTIAATDRTNSVAYSGSVAVAVTLPAASTFGNHFFFYSEAQSVGVPTFTPSSGQINGVSSFSQPRGNICTIYSPDNINYTADCSPGVVTWGSGLTATPSAHGVTVIASSGGVGTLYSATFEGQTVAASTTLFEPVSGAASAASSTESLRAAPIAAVCTAQNGYLKTNGLQSSTGSFVLTLHDFTTSTATGFTITVPAGAAAGNFTSSGTATITAGDSYSWQLVNNATATSAELVGAGFQCK